jgi:hypothetical protein
MASGGDDDSDRDHAADLRPEHHTQRSERPALPGADEVGDTPRKARAQRKQQRGSQTGRTHGQSPHVLEIGADKRRLR